VKKLPKSIEIFGQVIKVETVDNLCTIGDRFGDWDNKTNTIRIQTPGKGMPNDVIFATFFHELTHAVLDLTGHTELSSDESFTERLGQAFYQAEKTRKHS
jgi:hypothetical protein